MTDPIVAAFEIVRYESAGAAELSNDIQGEDFVRHVVNGPVFFPAAVLFNCESLVAFSPSCSFAT